MPRRLREPRWISRAVLDAIQGDQIREHGGLAGVRDENGLESALARARQKWTYADERDLAVLAAAYGFGIATSHPYRDGNKRMAFLGLATFLAINDRHLDSSDVDVVTTMAALAAGAVTEDALADWIRARLAP